MKSLDPDTTRKFALEHLKKLPALKAQAQIIHIESMIVMIETLADSNDRRKLAALAWLHDLGKTMTSDDHAKHSLAIAAKSFSLDATDQDCILHHGSATNPTTPLGNIFRYCDGLSTFVPINVHMLFYRYALEGYSFEQSQARLVQKYQKLLARYKDEKVKARLRKMFDATGLNS